MVVDLPEPDGPITATNAPCSTCISTPFSAWKAAGPDPKVLVIPSNEISGVVSLLAAVTIVRYSESALTPVTTFIPGFSPSPRTTVTRPSL